MSEAEKLFHKLGEEIPGVKPVKMFGAACLKTPNGKSGAMFWKNCVVVKLKGDALAEAMSLVCYAFSGRSQEIKKEII